MFLAATRTGWMTDEVLRELVLLRSGLSANPPQGSVMSKASDQKDWSKPAAMAIPKGGYFPGKVEQGRYGPIFPRTPACYGFSIVAKIIPGREEVF